MSSHKSKLGHSGSKCNHPNSCRGHFEGFLLFFTATSVTLRLINGENPSFHRLLVYPMTQSHRFTSMSIANWLQRRPGGSVWAGSKNGPIHHFSENTNTHTHSDTLRYTKIPSKTLMNSGEVVSLQNGFLAAIMLNKT